MEGDELPAGWAAATVDDLGEYINGCAFKPADWHKTGTPIVRIQNLTDPGKPLNVTQREVDIKYHIDKRDILVSWSATLDVFRWSGPLAYVNQHIFKVVPSVQIDDRFVEFALKKAIAELLNSEHLHGSTMKHINRKPFLAHPINIPPLPEQQRIVEKIETLFAELDKGEEALREVQKLLARYRQSVLKAAVTGTLTADWRVANGSAEETGHDLLDDVKDERVKSGRRNQPLAPKIDKLMELPSSWAWSSLDELLHDGPTNGVSPKQADAGGTPSFKLTATTSGKFIISDDTVKRVNIEPEANSKFWLKAGDVLIQRGNTIEYVGTAATFPGPDDQYIYPDLMMRVRFTHESLAKWTVAWINFEYAKRHFRSLATGTAGNMPKINGTTLKSLAVPIPPLEEIHELLHRLNDNLSKVTPIVAWCETELKRAAGLRQSILKDAFSGKLVLQDPADEAAADLLKRIRISREEKPSAKRMKRTK